MWATVEAGRAWRGEVCNRAKDGSLFWADTVLAPFFGGITLLVGAVLAVRQTDLKLMLAYTTVASLGLLHATVSTPASTTPTH